MINITTLSNGFRIATDYIPHVETASIGIWVKCGARKETVETNGIAHFLEHMAFKGTTTRTAKEIAESSNSILCSCNERRCFAGIGYLTRYFK